MRVQVQSHRTRVVWTHPPPTPKRNSVGKKKEGNTERENVIPLLLASPWIWLMIAPTGQQEVGFRVNQLWPMDEHCNGICSTTSSISHFPSQHFFPFLSEILKTPDRNSSGREKWFQFNSHFLPNFWSAIKITPTETVQTRPALLSMNFKLAASRNKTTVTQRCQV